MKFDPLAKRFQRRCLKVLTTTILEHGYTIPDKKEMLTVVFSHSVYLLGSCNLINKIVTTCRFVTELQFDINEYPYLYFA